ncbi:hypothetical protein [Agrobacterium fabrum]|uniref:hypothetical protein n=1 Tax=Agrobacterium fabrum TaxID=1176649 RepID=UPI003BA2521F
MIEDDELNRVTSGKSEKIVVDGYPFSHRHLPTDADAKDALAFMLVSNVIPF